MSSRCRRTRASSSVRWTSPTSISSRACRRPSPSTRSPPAATRDRRSAPSPRSTTTCGCCSPAPAGRTARSAASRSAASRRSRSSTGCWRCRRAPGSRSSRRWSAVARVSTSRSSGSWPRPATAGPGWTARSSSSIDPPTLDKKYKHSIDVIVDRLAVKPSSKQRLTDSVETALGLAQGVVSIDFVDLDPKDPLRERRYSEKMACPNDHDIAIEELEPRQFSFNGPWGACPDCSGLGTRMEVDPELVVPDDEKSLSEGAIAPWASAHVADYFIRLIDCAGRERRIQHQGAVAPVAGRRPEAAAVRRARPGARDVQEPVRPDPQLQRQVRGRRLLHRATARRGRDRHLPRAVRRLHA